MKAKLFLMLALGAAGVSANVQAARFTRSTGQRSTPDLQFLGFTLGQPPTLIVCPTTRDGLFDARSWSPTLDSTCMESPTQADTSADGRAKTLPVHFSRSEEPALAAGVHALGFALVILDGTVQGVLVRTSGLDSQKAVYAMLRKKYGVPTSLTKAHGQNSTGKAAESIGASWIFADLRVSFEGIGTRTDEGALSVETASAFERAMTSPPAHE
jgi:hypothetical protein